MTDKELKELAKHNNYPEEHLPMLVDFGRAVLMARRQFDLEEMTRAVRAERNKVAQWMIQRSYATGHGDSVDRKSTRLNSSHSQQSRMPSSA